MVIWRRSDEGGGRTDAMNGRISLTFPTSSITSTDSHSLLERTSLCRRGINICLTSNLSLSGVRPITAIGVGTWRRL